MMDKKWRLRFCPCCCAQAVEALADCVQRFQGGVLIVSHDQFFVSKVPPRCGLAMNGLHVRVGGGKQLPDDGRVSSGGKFHGKSEGEQTQRGRRGPTRGIRRVKEIAAGVWN